MKAITNAKAGKNIVRKIFAVLAMVVLLFSVVKIGNSLASDETFGVTGVTVIAKADTVTVNELTFDSSTIRSNVTMRQVGDNITYKIVLKNNSSKNYTLKSISDDNQSDFISYKYENYAGTKMNANESQAFNITAIYSKEQTDTSARNVSFSVRFILNFEDEEGNEHQEVIDVDPEEKPTKPSKTEEIIEKIKSPQTGDNIGAYIGTAIVSLIVLILTCYRRGSFIRVHNTNKTNKAAKLSQKNQKIAKAEKITPQEKSKKANQKKSSSDYILFSKRGKHSGKGFKFFVMILAAILMFPSISKANVDTVSIIFENDIQLMSKLVINIDTDGDGEPDTTKTVNYNDPIGEIENPEKDGYEFTGWEDKDGNEVDPGTTPITDDTTIKPTFKPTTYSITYNLIEGNLPEGKENPETYTIESSEITLENPEKNGYDFAGWSGTGLTGENNKEVKIQTGSKGAREYTAHYTPIEYEIKYNGLTQAEESSLRNPTSYTIEDNTIDITNPEREGYTFDGWSGTGLTSVTKALSISHGSTGAKEYTAHFTPIEYTISYSGITDEEREALRNPIKYTIESNQITLSNPGDRYDGDGDLDYTFVGWKEGETTTINAVIEAGTTGPRSFEAVWVKADPDTYAITYDLAGGSLATSNPLSYTKFDNTFTLNNPTREGYNFLGWTGSNGNTPQTTVQVVQGTRGPLSFTANWEEISYTLRLFANHAGDASYKDVELTYTQSYTLTTEGFTREGYNFLYWSDDQYSGTVNYELNTSVSKLTTEDGTQVYLYAMWEGIPLEVQYSYNIDITMGKYGFVGPSDASTVTYQQEDLPIILPECTGNGFEFEGWSFGEPNGPFTHYLEIPAGTHGYINPYGNFKRITYHIYYDYDGGVLLNGEENPETYTIQDCIILKEPYKEGHTFNGWKLRGTDTYITSINDDDDGSDKHFEDLYLDAQYTPIEYTITLAPTEGTVTGNTIINKNYGETVGQLPEPTRTGYKFTGWYNKSYPNLPVDENTVVEGDMELDADWEEISYIIYFYSNIPGDGQYQEVHLTYTQEITFHDYQMSRDGYTQTTWTTNPDGTGTEYSMLEFGNRYSSVDGDRIDLYAQWQGLEYTIEYRYNYDMSHHLFNGPTQSTTYTPEDCPISIADASATGFTFDGWSLSEYGMPSTNFEIPEGTWGHQTLHGHFTPINYNITYNYDGGDIPNGGSNPDTYTVEDTIYLIAPEKPGHTFDYWSVDGYSYEITNYLNGNNYADNITVVAHYTTNTYKISFETYGGTSYADRYVKYGDPIGALPTPQKLGYSFGGWYADEYWMTSADANTLCQGEATIYAKWDLVEYTITYNGLDNYNGPWIDNPNYYSYESESFYLNNPQDIYDNDGDLWLAFTGWSESGGYPTTSMYIPQGSTGNRTFTATWSEVDPPTYHITYNTHGFATSLQNPEFYTKKTPTFTLSNAEAEGYDFGGWSGTGLIGNDNKVVTIQQGTRGDLEFELHMIPHTYYIRFDANGGEGEEITEQYTWNLNGYLPANPYTREGYTFAGWNEAQDGSSWLHQPGDNVLSITPEQDAVVVYYATWTPNNYTISFNANADGVTGTMYPQSATYDIVTTLVKNSFEKIGYKFANWNTKADGTGDSYADEAEVINLVSSGIAQLFARWAVTPYTIVFDKNNDNATGTMDSMSVPYGEAVNLNPITYTYTDHKLKEWNTKADGTGIGYADEAEVMNLDIDGEVTLYAQWREIESTFDTGTNVRVKMAALANDDLTNITAVKPYNGTPDISGFTDDNIVSTRTSPDPIYAWFDNGTMYYWSEDTHPAINADAGTMFSGFSAATEIDIKNVDTTNMVYMRNMFSNCSSLTELDLSNNSFANVKNMYCTFYGASNLETLKLGSDNEETSIVTMQSTFAGCSKLTDLEVNVKIDKVTNMDSTFRGCGIVSVDFSNFDTSNVTNMFEMFRGCGKLEEVNFGETFNTANVNRMAGMFRECRSLTELDLSGFSSENLTSITEMFRDSNKIEHITFGPDFTAKKIGSLYYVFSGCSKLQELDLSNFETNSLTDMRGTFCQCGSMTDITFSDKFNTSQVTNMNSTFERCGNLTELDLSSFDFSSVTNINYMFGYCGRLERIIGDFESESVQNMGYTFYNCQSLEEMDLSKLGLENVTTMSEAFSYCYAIKDIQFKQDTTTSNLTSLFAMYRACGELTELDMSMFDTTNVGRADVMFSGCGKLKTIYATDKFTLVDKDFNDAVFTGCGSLVGGAGTRISAEHLDKSYGHIDGGTSNPGYFTDKTKLNIFYYPNGENVTGTMTNQTTQANTDIQLNDNQYTNLGYAFGGWNTKPDGSGTHYDNEQVVNAYGSLFLYAQWGVTPYTVIFDKNADDATGSMESIQKAYGEHFNLPANVYTRNGYAFDGWNSKADGTGRHYEDEQSVVNLDIDGEVTLYAEWVEMTAVFKNSTSVRNSIKALVPEDKTIRKIKNAAECPDLDNTAYEIVSVADSYYPIYMWFDEDTEIIYYWSQAEKEILNADSAGLFSSYTNVTEIDTANLDTSRVTSMERMFQSCPGLTELDLSTWNTENVTSMAGMFGNCTGLTELDLTNFNTGKVTNISVMFQNCTGLTSLDVSTWNTSEVTNMKGVFGRETWGTYGCTNLTELDLRNWNTSKVTNMENMFYGCTNLKEVQTDKWDTSNVTKMCYMFANCNNLETLDATTLDLTNVTTTTAMFSECSKLQILDVEDWETGNVTAMNSMFAGCKSLYVLDPSGWDTSKVTTFANMFGGNSYNGAGCESLTVLDLSEWNTDSATNMSSMFTGCISLSSLDVSGFNTSNVTTMSSMFGGTQYKKGCESLTELDITNFITNNVTDMSNMFRGCFNLSEIDVSSFNTDKVTNMGGMFCSCKSMEVIDIDNFNTSNVTNMEYMFAACRDLTTIDLTNFDTKKVTNMGDMFQSCRSLVVLDLTSFETSTNTNMTRLFYEAKSLRTIYATDNFNHPNSAYCPFFDTSLIGGAGTRYAYEHMDIDYACIDNPDNGRPGYFTDKNKLNVYYYPNGNDVTGTMQNQTVQANTNLTLNSNQYVRLGYAYGGWNTEADGSGTHYADGQVVNGYGSLFLYAQWGITPYTVIFDKNSDDATGSMSSISKAYGEHFNLPANGFERRGYYLAGWNTKADGTGIHYDDEADVVNLDIDGEVTLYAEWAEKVAIFNQGVYVSPKIAALIADSESNNIAIKESLVEPDLSEMTSDNIVSYPTSPYPIYMWLDGETVYWWTEDIMPEMHSNSRELFANLPKVTSIETTKIDTSKAKDMRNLFFGTGITSVDLSTWDTSSVTSIGGMFSNSKVTTVDLSTFDTSNLTSINNLFTGATNLTSVNFGDSFDTSKVTTMSQMFWRCTSLQSITFGAAFDTSNVRNMDSMFQQCTSLESIDFGPAFSTDSVTNMDRMFQQCSSLQSIDLSKFNTSKVTTMYCMFSGCNSVASLDFGTNFDVRRVKSMDMMFNGCRTIETLDLSGFKTEALTSMSQMFQGCTNLKTINFGNHFDTSRVESFGYLFYQCSNLESLNLSSWDTTNVTRTDVMFQDCPKLASITFGPNFKCKKVTNMSQMFQNCKELQNLDLSYFELDSAVNMSAVFRGCSKVESITFGNNVNTRNATNMAALFAGCSKLQTLDLSNFHFENVTTIKEMCNGCSSLQSINFGNNVNTTELTDTSWMFYRCASLTSIDMSKFNGANVTNTSIMFQDCTNLETIDLGAMFATNSITNANQMFQGTSKLTTIYVTGFDTSSIENGANMFRACSVLAGGQGTRVTAEHLDQEYARIDDPDNGAPGYFTTRNRSIPKTTNSVNSRTLNAPLDTDMVTPDSTNDRSLNVTMNEDENVDDDEIIDDKSEDTTDEEELEDSDIIDNTQEEVTDDNSDTNVDELDEDTKDNDKIEDNTKDESVSNDETEEVTNEEVPEQGTEETKED